MATSVINREAHRQFRKKPVVIHAVQWTGSNVDEILDFICAKADARRVNVGGIQNGIAIETLEGTMIANPGDWIIRGLKGEFYPCKPDIFEASYDHAPTL